MSFWVKTIFLGQEVHYDMVHIAYYTELNLKICNYTQKRRKIANARLTKTFVAIFALAERRPTSATLEHTIFPYCQGSSRGAQQRPSLLEFITQITCAYYTDDADDDGDDDYDLS